MRLDEPSDEGEARGAHFVSRFTKNRNAPTDPVSFEWTIEPESAGTVEASADDVIVQWVRDGISTPSDIGVGMGISKGTVSRHASRLIKAGRLQKSGRGYALGPVEQ